MKDTPNGRHYIIDDIVIDSSDEDDQHGEKEETRPMEDVPVSPI